MEGLSPSSIACDSCCATLEEPCSGRAMTRCECAEISFAEVARRVAQGIPLAKVLRSTGCGGMCTACVPDLERYLSSR